MAWTHIPKPDYEARKQKLLAALAAGPQSMVDLAALSGLTVKVAYPLCQQLRSDGLIWLLGLTKRAQWVLADHPLALESKARAGALLSTPKRSCQKAGLRHPHERPTKVTVSLHGEPPWWATAPRDHFTSHVEREHGERMAHDPIARSITPPVLDSKIPMHHARFAGSVS